MLKRSAILLLLMLLFSGAILLLTASTPAASLNPACDNRCKPATPAAPRIHWNFLTSALFPAES